MSRGRRWTPDEDRILIDLYGTGLIWLLSERLGRTEKAIRVRASHLGLVRDQQHDGRRTAPDIDAFVALDGVVIQNADVLNAIREASGITWPRLQADSGYFVSQRRHLVNPKLRKVIDLAQAMGFELVLRRRA